MTHPRSISHSVLSPESSVPPPTHSALGTRHSALLRAAALVALGLLTACQSEETITRYHPFFANMTDAKTATPPVDRRAAAQSAPATTDDPTILKNKDGSVTLVAKSVRQLMQHLERTLDDGKQDDIIFNQLISQATKDYLKSEGADPRAIVQFLHDNRQDVALFFARMPLGEHSPTVVFEPTGDHQYVVRLTGDAAKSIRFTKLWVALERGNFKFLWLS